MVKGALVLILDAVWLSKLRSYAMETSPAAVKAVGRLLVTWVLETEKRELPAEVILKRLPVVSPPLPILMRNRSPEAVAGEEGDQSRLMSLPVVRAVPVPEILRPLPVVKELTFKVMALPVVAARPATLRKAEAVAVLPTLISSVM